MVGADGAPVATGEEMRIVTRLAIDVVWKHGNHVFIRVIIQMVNLVAAIQDVCKHVPGRRIDDGRGDDVWHVSIVAILRNSKVLVAVKAPDRSQMNVSTQDRDPDGPLGRQLLEFLN
jgi:hypothetical protein